VDVRDGAQRVVWDGNAGEPFSASTVAVRQGNVLIAGSLTDAGLLVCRLGTFEH
jgi:hypothetical protein